MGVYGDRELERWFVDAWRQAGKKLDMGKSCVRFKQLDDLPLDAIEATRRVGRRLIRPGYHLDAASPPTTPGPPRVG